jgi:hypothetical protein
MHQIPPWLTGGVAALVLSAAARALPDPRSNDSRVYLWFYNFAHALLANFDKVGQGAGLEKGS